MESYEEMKARLSSDGIDVSWNAEKCGTFSMSKEGFIVHFRAGGEADAERCLRDALTGASTASILKKGDLITLPYFGTRWEKIKSYFGYKIPEFKQYEVTAETSVDHSAPVIPFEVVHQFDYVNPFKVDGIPEF